MPICIFILFFFVSSFQPHVLEIQNELFMESMKYVVQGAGAKFQGVFQVDKLGGPD